jgi:hypothetical protein
MISCLVTGAMGQTVIPTPYWTSFFDSATTFNGRPVPVGSIIQAYDDSLGVLCGQDTVHIPGYYGFMPVYGDDPNTKGIYEGALPGHRIRFTINGRLATVVSGDPTWTDQTEKQVRLAAAATVSFSVISFPGTMIGAPTDTIPFTITVRNNGNGLDFYGVHVTETKDTSSWQIILPSALSYANPGQSVDVTFKIAIPLFPGDTLDHISYSVFSYTDTTVHVDSTVDLYASITDVNDHPGTLPNAFVLNQNYPNPFNPTTTISFSLPSNSPVRLEVYDILGRTVESRDLGALAAGSHEIEYDASNLASGVYLYRVVTNTTSLTRKMVLMK